MPKMPGGYRGGAHIKGGRPKADFNALGRAIKRLFAYYPLPRTSSPSSSAGIRPATGPPPGRRSTAM